MWLRMFGVTSDGGAHWNRGHLSARTLSSVARRCSTRCCESCGSRSESTRVYIAVRGYQQEIEPALARMGFAPGLTQELLVRYTAVQVRAVTTEASPQHVELGDRVPSQAPSILTATSEQEVTE